MRCSSAALALALPARPLKVSPLVLEVFEASPSLRAVGLVVHPPLGFSPPSESHETGPPLAVSGGSSFPEVSGLFAQSTPRVRSPRRVPIRRRLPPSGFLNLSAVCSPRRLRGLVPSRVHVQASPFRVFPSPGAVLARRQHLALLWLPRAGLLFRDDQLVAPLQGLAPPESPLRPIHN